MIRKSPSRFRTGFSSAGIGGGRGSERGASPFAWGGTAPLNIEAAPHDFHGAIAAAKQAHSSGASVTFYSPEECAGMRTFTAPDASAGVALNGDDIVSVFKHPDSPYRDAATSLINHAVAQGGRRLDAFDTVLPHIYGRQGFRAVARLPFDPQFAPEGWNYAQFARYNGGKPDIVFMVHDPYSPGYRPGDGKRVQSYDDAVALQKTEADRITVRKQAGEDRFNQLASQVSGLKGIAQYLTPPELELVTKRSAERLVDAFRQMPSGEEMAAAAYSGRAKRGWYRNSAQAIVNVFGTADAPRFTALLAALSPQTGVEDNLINALRVWNEWDRMARPRDSKSIVAIMADTVQGDKGFGSILGAWVPNTIRTLQAADPMALQISGPKVNSFMHNLRGA